MKIDSLYKDYVQKSKIFMYPLLNIPRGLSVSPINTYATWQDYYEKSDCKLSILFHKREDLDFKLFEEKRLLSNPLFYDYKVTEEGQLVYVFDYEKHRKDWEAFIKGKYSQLSTELKKKIQTYFGYANRGYIDSFLYPERYFKLYSELLTVTENDRAPMLNTLKEVGELCSKPDYELENLTVKIKVLHIQEKSL